MTMILGHRGASASHPENTLEAFVATREAGADGVELDVRCSRDGVLVVHHDAHLADGRLLADTPAGDLDGSIPTVEAALEVLDGLFVNLEVKHLPSEPDHDRSARVVEAVVSTLGSINSSSRLLISSFDMSAIDRVRLIAPSLETGWLFAEGGSVDATIERIVAHGHTAVHPHLTLADAGLVERAHDAGLVVAVWTVDEPERMIQLASLGVDALITNDPALAVRTLRAAA